MLLPEQTFTMLLPFTAKTVNNGNENTQSSQSVRTRYRATNRQEQ